MAITQTTPLRLAHGLFNIAYHKTNTGDCVSVRHGDVSKDEPIVRFHSSCMFGESLHALDCDCADQLTSTLKLIKQSGSGVIIYGFAEGRGVGLENKIRALELQRTQNLNTVEAFQKLGFKPDHRIYETDLQALKDLNVSQTISVATQNPHKLAVLRQAGYKIVEEIHPKVSVTKYNAPELRAKKEILGYHIP